MVRIVSLVPSLTDALAAMGRDGCVVGRTRYCPPSLDGGSEDVGGTKDPRVDLIVSLRPDAVLAVKEENRERDVEALRAAGLVVVVFEPRRLSDVPALAWSLGRLAGAARQGEAMAARAAAAIRMARGRAAERRRIRGAWLVWRGPFRIAGPDTYIADLLRACGVDDLFPSGESRYPEVAPPAIAAAGARIVFLPNEPFAFGAEHVPEFRALAGLGTEGPPATVLCRGDLVGWYPARTAEALRHVEEILLREFPG
ncbi:MAG: helical backbone metal receptor [Planctomycetes bacterium]|jgi:ABC-type Fe3+-hydroxamate transport system substrate-binding protein|nr:helical backbone metal receptor [Planctomycetota bacterium]